MINRKNILELPESWKTILQEEQDKSYFIELKKRIFAEYKEKEIRPEIHNIFKAFEWCSFDDTKVVLLGQDPYHNVGQAQGLSFSVPAGIDKPPSLINIFKELANDLEIEIPKSGCLESWARQGVLLLNSFLTVELHKPLSHSKIGWEIFTDCVIEKISDLKSNIVFLLWGSFAKNKRFLIDQKKHQILMSAHPSPLSSYKFFGCKHFSKTNDFLASKNIQPINWFLN
ncbi:MAG: uracil-DNA glycosylase [Candidatus Nanoarchaeia archaeon]|jgi:uracil-DNA glycosylase|nr:uracil-DNA glycosylase [Candidatus Nanoarchaeia archaeon]